MIITFFYAIVLVIFIVIINVLKYFNFHCHWDAQQRSVHKVLFMAIVVLEYYSQQTEEPFGPSLQVSSSVTNGRHMQL